MAPRCSDFSMTGNAVNRRSGVRLQRGTGRVSSNSRHEIALAGPRTGRDRSVLWDEGGCEETFVMRRISLTAAVILTAMLLAGCAGGDGVDKHLGAFHKGCVPSAGGVSCTGG